MWSPRVMIRLIMWSPPRVIIYSMTWSPLQVARAGSAKDLQNMFEEMPRELHAPVYGASKASRAAGMSKYRRVYNTLAARLGLPEVL